MLVHAKLVRYALALSMLAFVSMGSQARAESAADLARAWGGQAEVLYGDLEALRRLVEANPAGQFELPSTTRAELIRFAATADQLAAVVDASDGPKDLRCIFRGLSEEVAVQMDAIDAAEGAARPAYGALVRLTKAMDDSRMIAVAGASGLPNVDVKRPGTCGPGLEKKS